MKIYVLIFLESNIGLGSPETREQEEIKSWLGELGGDPWKISNKHSGQSLEGAKKSSSGVQENSGGRWEAGQGRNAVHQEFFCRSERRGSSERSWWLEGTTRMDP